MQESEMFQNNKPIISMEQLVQERELLAKNLQDS